MRVSEAAKTVTKTRTNLGERSARRDFFDALDKRTKILSSNARVANELNEVINDDNGPTLDLHAAIIQSSHKQGNEDSKSGSRDLGDEGLARQRLDAGRHGVRLRHAFHESRNVLVKVIISQGGAECGCTLDGSSRDLR